MFVEQAHEEMISHGYGYLITNPKRPSPYYYNDCKRYNWADDLIKSHKKHLKLTNGENVYDVEYTPEELEYMARMKLREGAQYLQLFKFTSILGMFYMV